MTPDPIEELVARRAAELSALPGGAAVARAKAVILTSLQPVRPLASTAALALRFLVVFAAVAIAAAAMIGMYGVRALSPLERGIIFPGVMAAAAFAAIAAAREMRPAGGRRSGGLALAAAGVGLTAVFALFFHDYTLQNFVAPGVRCLRAGLEFSGAAAVLVCILLRRGYIQNLAAAGLAAGTLTGLAGLGALELHCPILKAMHVMVWHVAVVIISGAAGWTIGRVADVRRGRGAA